MWIICTAFLCSVAFCTATRQEYGLCSQVYLMSQYCSNNDVTHSGDVTIARGPVGKSGRPGQAGPRGLPGIVNYTNIGETIATKIKEIEKKFESKFEEYEIVMNRTLSNLEKMKDRLPPTGCHEAKLEKAKTQSRTGGVFDVLPHYEYYEIEVFCDLTTDGGGWTVFQRRFDGSLTFDRYWSSYVDGFGALTEEFWLGLEKLHLLTRHGEHELRIELTDNDGRIGIATYQTFSISGSSENYKLNVGRFSGTGVSDGLAWHNNMAFTTKDRDNDKLSSGNCAVRYGGGGWWFNACSSSKLNHAYGSIYWSGFNNIKKTEMKFRKK